MLQNKSAFTSICGNGGRNIFSLLSHVAVTCLLCTSCATTTGDESRPLCGELEAFTLRLPGDTTRLTGIRHRVTGDTLVSPQHFISVTADSCIVKAMLPDKRLWVYSDRGLPLLGKTFDSFVYVNLGEGMNQRGEHEHRRFYVGTDYDRTYYYFPARHLLLDVTEADLSGDGIVLSTSEGGFVTYDYNGERVSQTY